MGRSGDAHVNAPVTGPIITNPDIGGDLFLSWQIEGHTEQITLGRDAPTADAEIAPSLLLRAQFGLTPFHGRGAEMDLLRRWADSDETAGLALVTGPGGQGKTRLAIELIRGWRDQGWYVGFLDADATPDGVRGLGELEGRVCLVVDYAEIRLPVLAAVITLAARRGETTRVLAIARERGDWWGQLAHQDGAGLDVEMLQDRALKIELAPLAPTATVRREVYDGAVDAFARLRQLDRPAVDPELDDPVFASALYLTMAAFTSVDPEIPPLNPDLPLGRQLLDAVLSREADCGRAAREPTNSRPKPATLCCCNGSWLRQPW